VEIRNLEAGPGGGFTLRLAGAGSDNRPDSMQVVGQGIFPLGWDPRGNLSVMPATPVSRRKAFTYSAGDRLQEVVDVATGTTWRFAYDADGERVLSWRRDAGGQLAEVRVDLRDEDGAVLSDWLLVPDASFGPVTDYLRADGRMAIQLDHGAAGLIPLFAAHDHLGSTRALVAADGTLADVIDYLPYGRLRGGGAAPATSHLFTGHQRDLGDTTSELDYMHARHYSPLLGRFTSIDTVRGDPSSSQSWNRYAYTAGNPLRAIDPDGRYERDVHYNLTHYLALKAGWSQRGAESIAGANQGVDELTGANPLNPRNFALHFGTLADAMVHVDAARSPAELGAALHSVQDSFSHEGYGWPFGHGHMNVIGRSPDDPWRDVPKAMEMAETSFELLGGDREDLNREFLEVLFRTESMEERIKMLEDAVSCHGVGIPTVVGITPADEFHERLIRDYYLRNRYDLRTE
jgi:RHS repeat-associated protein